MKYRLNFVLALVLFMSGVFSLTVDTALAGDAKIVYRLKWLRNMSTVGDLYAEAYGYFKGLSLNVTIKPGGPEIDTIRELELGYAHFGVASADQVIRALSKGAPVVVVAQLFQVNPLQWIYRQDRFRIEKPADLKGRTLGVTFGKNDEMIMRTLLASAQLKDNQVKLFSVRLDYTPFYKGLVDLWPVYINTQGVEIGGKLRASGERIGFFNPNEHGVRFVANSVVTSEKMMAQHPDRVKRFICALLQSWDEAMKQENRSRAIDAVRRYDRDTAPGVLERQLKATRALSHLGAKVPVGTIDRDAWQATEDIMLVHQQISRPVNVVRHLHPVECK